MTAQRPGVGPYAVVVGSVRVPVPSLRSAVSLLLAVCAADPEVTCMPYVAREDGGILDEVESDTVDRLMDEAP